MPIIWFLTRRQNPTSFIQATVCNKVFSLVKCIWITGKALSTVINLEWYLPLNDGWLVVLFPAEIS